MLKGFKDQAVSLGDVHWSNPHKTLRGHDNTGASEVH